MRIPFVDLRLDRKALEPELSAAIGRVLDDGRFVLGPEVEAFEREFAAFCGTRHCVGVGSGLDALRLLLRASGVGPGDEVLVPAYTAVATWMAVTATGALPVGVDVDPGTRTLAPDLLRAAVTPRTRAVVAVHLFGLPADVEAIEEVASEHGLPVFEDAAHAHGAKVRERTAGSLAAGAAFSFYPTKNLGALGDGGAVTTDDDALADEVRAMRTSGRGATRAERHALSSRLDEMQAAVLRVKLRRLDAWNARRATLAARYLAGLGDMVGLDLPVSPDRMRSAWHLFAVGVDDRDSRRRRLAERGIETLVHYDPPPHRTPAFRRDGLEHRSFPSSEQIARRALSLPLHPHLGEEAVEEVIRAVISTSPRSGVVLPTGAP